jgi:hypothetical protein
MTPPASKKINPWIPDFAGSLTEPTLVLPFGNAVPPVQLGDFSLSPGAEFFQARFGVLLTAEKTFPLLWAPLPANAATSPVKGIGPLAWTLPAAAPKGSAPKEPPSLAADRRWFALPHDAENSLKVWEEIHNYQKNPADQWVDFLAQLFNNVLTLDLDFENVPVNRGSELTRFSEYQSRRGPRTPPIIKVYPNTVARAHGEIRPIKGRNESWITRVGWDKTPNVYYENKDMTFLPNLEIDGAGAVDPPAMKFDFSKGRGSVLAMSGGDNSYENPRATGDPMRTPFDAVTNPPPGGHNYWMFRFNPTADTALAGLMEATSNGAFDPVITSGLGALLLWAYLPTVGLTSPERYKEVNVPYNTFPRRFGDLIKLLRPMFDAEWAENLRQAAPFYNPNSEFIMPLFDEKGKLRPFPKNWREVVELNQARKQDCEAKRLQGRNDCLPLVGRQPIPEDPKEVERIDAFFKKAGLESFSRKRGGIIDWIFTTLALDPTRLKGMKDFPRAVLHFKMRETTLETPFGRVKIDPTTDIKVYYHIFPVQNPVTGRTESRIGLRADISPLKLENVDLEMGNYHVAAKRLKAKKLVFQFPSIPGFSQEDPSQRPPWTISLEGVEAEGLKVGDNHSNFNVEMDSAKIGELGFVYDEEWKAGTLKEWQSRPPDGVDLSQCKYRTVGGGEKYACYYQTEYNPKKSQWQEWRGYAPQEFTGAWSLPETTRVVYKSNGRWKINIQKIAGNGLHLDSALGKLNAGQFSIPAVHMAAVVERRPEEDSRGRPIQKDAFGLVSLTVPEIKSNIGLNLKIEGAASESVKPNGLAPACGKNGGHQDAATWLALKGSTSLTGLRYLRKNQESEVLTQLSAEMAGVIQSAELCNPIFGRAKFTTQEDPAHVHRISGRLSSTSVGSLKDPEAQPKSEFNLDLDLPYVGFESSGLLDIPSGSSTLQRSHLKLSKDADLKVQLSGYVDLRGASHRNGEKLEWGSFSLTPNLSNLNIQGDFAFELSPQGFRLYSPEGSTPPRIEADLDGSKFVHRPDLSKDPIGRIPESAVIKTDLALDSTKVKISGLQNVEVVRVIDGEVKRNKMTQLDAGPITVHHIQGSGDIWAPLPLWGFVRGFFPKIGGSERNEEKQPDPSPLTQHLPEAEREELRRLLGDGDFVHFGKIKLETSPEGKWGAHFRDFMMNLHEADGLNQVVLLRVPELNIGNKNGAPLPDLGSGGFLSYILLHRPLRGGLLQFQRPGPAWWKKGK